MKAICLSLGLLCLVSVSLLVCSPREENPPQKAADHGGAVLKDLPADIRLDARYLFYLHGAIIEEGELRPEHPRFGFYEYEAILDSLAAHGLVVISEARKAGTDVGEYARKVVSQIEQLLTAGISPKRISVAGHSKGGIIAIRVCSTLQIEHVNFILLACCFEGILRPPGPNLCGRVLSIYDASDELAGSCQRAFDMATQPLIHHEIKLQTGEGHGAFYRPMPEWIDPVVDWIKCSDLEELVHKYVDACNRHDLKTLRDMLAEEVVWYLEPYTLVGKEQVLGPLAYDEGINTTLQCSNVVVKGDTVEFELVEKNDVLTALGIPEIRHFPRFIYRDGLLQEKSPRKPRTRARELDQRIAALREWIQANHPDALAQLEAPDGSFIFSRENGHLVVKLLEEWRSGGQSQNRD